MDKKPSKTELKKLAQDMIMHQMSAIGYGEAYDEFIAKVGNEDEANAIMLGQMDRVAKLFGFKEAWFS